MQLLHRALIALCHPRILYQGVSVLSAQVRSTASKGFDSRYRWAAVILLLVAVAGLYYVKWNPYVHKAITAAAKHSIGASKILAPTSAAPPAVGWQAGWQYTVGYINDIYKAMILGLLLGSGLQVLLPRDWLLRTLGKASFGKTAAAAAASLPGMMCTCCAAPVAVGLAKNRVNAGSALAFFLGNPTLNPATLIFMGFVLGWKWTVLRAVFGLILVLGVSHLANRFMNPKDLPAEAAAEVAAAQAAAEPVSAGALLVQWLKVLWRMVITLVPEYLVVVLLLGAARAWLFPAINPAIGQSIGLMLVLAITGTLFVIPTAGEIPIVQALQGYGLGAGGAGALLITLPSVSLPSLLMVGQVLPKKVMTFVGVSVAVLGILAGLTALALGF